MQKKYIITTQYDDIEHIQYQRKNEKRGFIRVSDQTPQDDHAESCVIAPPGSALFLPMYPSAEGRTDKTPPPPPAEPKGWRKRTRESHVFYDIDRVTHYFYGSAHKGTEVLPLYQAAAQLTIYCRKLPPITIGHLSVARAVKDTRKKKDGTALMATPPYSDLIAITADTPRGMSYTIVKAGKIEAYRHVPVSAVIHDTDAPPAPMATPLTDALDTLFADAETPATFGDAFMDMNVWTNTHTVQYFSYGHFNRKGDVLAISATADAHNKNIENAIISEKKWVAIQWVSAPPAQ